MRKLTTLTALVCTLALLVTAGGMTAYADPGAPPGANGTVKVHEYPDHKNASDNANDPQVCRFEIHGNGFDAGQSGRWWIQDHKWAGGDAANAWPQVGIRTYTANTAGDWTDNNGGTGFKIDDGHYKLFVEMTHSAGNSGNTVTTYKHKVFKVSCEVATAPTTTTPTTTAPTTTAPTTTTPTTAPTTTAPVTTVDTQVVGSVVVRTETRTVVDGHDLVRTISVFNNDVLVSTTTTRVAGFEAQPPASGSVIAPTGLRAIAALPATSTSR